MADDNGAWHAFALRGDLIVIGRPKYCRLERICDGALGRGRDKPPKLRREPQPRGAQTSCDACRVELERLWALPEPPPERSKIPPPRPAGWSEP